MSWEEWEVFAKDFDRLMDVAQTIPENDPDKDMMYSGDGQQGRMYLIRKEDAIRKGIEIILTESKENKTGHHYYCSDPAQIGIYRVYAE